MHDAVIQPKSILFFFLSLCVIYDVTGQMVPIEITNEGEVQIDQQNETLVIEKNVWVHQQPYYLSADSVSLSRETNSLVATGDVRVYLAPSENAGTKLNGFLAESIEDSDSLDRIEILRTTELSFDAKQRVLQPVGSAEIQFAGARIIGNNFSLDMSNETITTGDYRVGFGLLFLEGNSLHAQQNTLFAKDTHFYIGEPEKLSIQGHADTIEKRGEEAVILKGIRLQVGPVPVFYWPYYKHHLNRRVFSVSGGAGYSGDIGAYVELRGNYQPSDTLSYFTDFNLYSERGVLVGPGFNLEKSFSSGHTIKTHLETGYINDNGLLGVDILGNPIESERHYIDFSFLHQFGESTQLLTKFERWSDSEVLRDFSTGKFRSIQQPQSFLEWSTVWGPLALQIDTHLKHEDFEFAIERLPQMGLTLLPTRMLNSGIYHSGSISGVRLRNNNPNLSEDLESTRYRAYYQLLMPIALNQWLDFIPQATAQRLYYDDTGGDETSFGKTQIEFGFDLTAHGYGDWEMQNNVWDINGIRHLLRPTIQFRKLDISGSENQIPPPIESEVFRTGIDDLDLTANPYLDDIHSGSILRMGIMNSLIARRKNGTVRELAEFDIFHDFYFSDSTTREDSNRLATELTITPAHWLRLDLQSRFDTDDFEMTDLFGRIQLIDGDVWDLDLATQFIENDLEQYLLDFRYKVLENVSFVSSLGYDAQQNRFYEQTYGFQIGIANYWDLYVSVNTRQGSTRNDQTRFELKIKSAKF